MKFNSQLKVFILLFAVTVGLVWFLGNQIVRVQAQTQTPVREPVTGSCECPYDRTTSGRLCGGNSSYSRSGGTSRPVCYLEDQPTTTSSPSPTPSPTTLPSPTVSPTPTPSSTSIHMKFGNPTNATSELTSSDNYLMTKPQYALSYNRSKGIPNWVSWQLSAGWLGDAPRQDDFRPDASLPSGWYRVTPSDYTNSGFDRGHMTSSEDRGANIEDNSSTFLMTNILPQSPDNNRGPWVQLENYSRELVKQGKELYILSGGQGDGGTGEKGSLTTLAGGKVAVPANTWKIILVLDTPGAAVTETTRTIAVLMPNTQGIRLKKWQDYRVSIDDVEKFGFDFFSSVPENVQAVIEAKIDNL
jgi:endonuclease G, mitochondrial